jgi:hypothetical protein
MMTTSKMTTTQRVLSGWTRWAIAVVCQVLVCDVGALMFDVVDVHKQPPFGCRSGCARWAHLEEDGAVLPLMQTNWLASRFTDGKM